MNKTLLFLLLLGSFQAFSQEPIPLQSCEHPQLKRQADSVKQVMERAGFTLLREATFAMESEYEQPVVLPMQEGGLYHVVFIGDPASKLYEVRMYDWEEKMVVYKKYRPDPDGNLIAYDYIPIATEYHMIKPLQVSKEKKKGLCGYFILFKKTTR